MTEILAIQPNGGDIIHLHVPGYQPGKKPRSIGDVASLCNGDSATRRRTVPLAEALEWPHKTCGCGRTGWRWCRPCLGHAATLVGVVDQVLAAIVEAGQP